MVNKANTLTHRDITLGDEDCGIMATAPLGTLQEFQPESKMIKDYLERVQLYIEAKTADRVQMLSRK